MPKNKGGIKIKSMEYELTKDKGLADLSLYFPGSNIAQGLT